MKTEPDYPLGYSPEWEALLIITREQMDRDQDECAQGADPHPEHYRWRAFKQFVHSQPTISPAVARRLYSLGEADTDAGLGESMRSLVLRRDDCPTDLFEAGLKSSSKHLRNVAEARIGGKTPGQSPLPPPAVWPSN